MKEQLEIVLKLDPNYHDAYNVWRSCIGKCLAVLYQSVTRKSSGIHQESYRIGTTNIGHWLLYGEIAISNKDYVTARMALNKVLSCQIMKKIDRV